MFHKATLPTKLWEIQVLFIKILMLTCNGFIIVILKYLNIFLVFISDTVEC